MVDSLRNLAIGYLLFGIVVTGLFFFLGDLMLTYGVGTSENEKRIFGITENQAIEKQIDPFMANRSLDITGEGIDISAQTAGLATGAPALLITFLQFPWAIDNVIVAALSAAGLPLWLNGLFWGILFFTATFAVISAFMRKDV